MLIRLRRMPVTVALLAPLVVASGCSGSSAPSPGPTASTTPSSTSPSPIAPAQQMQQLAAKGSKAVFHATYVVRQSRPSSRAEWQVWRTSSSLRVDVVTKHSTATLISTPRATFSCNRASHHRACFRVAKAGQPIPQALQLLAVRLFGGDLAAIAQHPERYGIAAATPGSVTVPTHGATCFHLTVPRASAKSGVETGSYCLDPNGILTVVSYPNGNVVRLAQLSMRTPSTSAFVPYSSPTPLPG